MKKADLHIDMADIYNSFGLASDEFFRKDSDAPITLCKLEQTGIDVVALSLYFDKGFVKTDFHDGVKGYHAFYESLLSKTGRFHHIKSYEDLKNKPEGKIGYLYAIEGFDCFRSQEDLEEFYGMGVRCFAPAWATDNDYACGRHTESDRGLTAEGKELINRMNGRKLIMDVTHLSEKSVLDLAGSFDGTIVATHSNADKICSDTHNLTDDEIGIIAERGGVIGLFPLVECVGGKGTMEDLYRHLDYIAGKWGVEHIGFSSDIYPLPEYPFINDVKDVLVLNDIEEYLLTRMGRNDVEKVMRGNWMSVLEDAL